MIKHHEFVNHLNHLTIQGEQSMLSPFCIQAN